MRNLLEEYPLYKVENFNSLQEMLINSSKKYPNKLALEYLNQTPIPKLTYSELYEKVFQFGKH